MAHTLLGVRRRRPTGTDSQGFTVRGALGPLDGPWDGRVAQKQVGEAASIGLDVAAWPLEPLDVVVEPSTGLTWLIQTAELITNRDADDADYIRVTAAPQDEPAAGTEPGIGQR